MHSNCSFSEFSSKDPRECSLRTWHGLQMHWTRYHLEILPQIEYSSHRRVSQGTDGGFKDAMATRKGKLTPSKSLRIFHENAKKGQIVPHHFLECFSEARKSNGKNLCRLTPALSFRTPPLPDAALHLDSFLFIYHQSHSSSPTNRPKIVQNGRPFESVSTLATCDLHLPLLFYRRNFRYLAPPPPAEREICWPVFIQWASTQNPLLSWPMHFTMYSTFPPALLFVTDRPLS